MKKKIVLLITVTTIITGLLAGCGNSASNTGNQSSKESSSKGSEKITVSEMLDSVIKENGGSVYIYTSNIQKNNFDNFIQSNHLDAHIYKYDGTTLYNLYADLDNDPDYIVKPESEAYFASGKDTDNTLRESAEEWDEFQMKNIDHIKFDGDKPQKVQLTFDDDGVEILPSHNNGTARIAFWDDFYHIENGGVSYMVFHTIAGSSGTSNAYIFIEDTDYTKDKKVVPDTDL